MTHFMPFYKYAGVGLCSTSLHAVIAFSAVYLFDLTLVSSNILAFSISALCTYMGNTFITFRVLPSKSNVLKFIIYCLGNYCLINFVCHFFDRLGFSSYITIIFLLLIIPVVGFFLLKKWVFSNCQI